jgi:2-keto-4-pentenoate hydratase
VFGFAAVPDAAMDDAALAACLAWVAHGVEIVHTHVQGWHFDGPALPVADFGLHGRLVVGPRRPVSAWPSLGADLAAMTMTLRRGGQVVDRGQGALVLDGPLQALGAWLRAAAGQAPGADVVAGDVVTTGTLTDAWPVAPGEVWTTEPGDARLPGLTIRFTA